MKFKFVVFLICVSIVSSFSQTVVDASAVSNQPKENSPLSRYGLGNFFQQTTVAGGSMGGLSATFRDPYIFNPHNPASLPSLRATDFEVGVYAKNNSIADSKSKFSGWSGNINHIALAFPTYSVINEFYDRKPRKIRYAMGFSLMPYTTVGYNIVTESKPSNTDSVTISNYYLGSGGTYIGQWSHGISYKGLSVGVNAGYLFGRVTNVRQTDLSSNLITPYANYFEDYFNLKSITWKIGLQYDIILDPNKDEDKGNKKHIILGAIMKPAADFTTNSGSFYRRVGGTTDTLSFPSEVAGTGTLPMEWTAGVAYEYSTNFRIGAEYTQARWSQYKNTAKPEALKDITQLGVGAEFILNKSKNKLDEEKARWRIGFRTGTDPRVLQGEQIKQQTYSIGVNKLLRVGRTKDISFMNFGLAYDRLSTSKLKENAVRFTLGLTLNDNTWFLKRRFQ